LIFQRLEYRTAWQDDVILRHVLVPPFQHGGDFTWRLFSEITAFAGVGREIIELPVTDMCEATGTSERTLQYAFRKTLDMTPIEYLIRLRLHRVRQDLQNAKAKSTTVSRIAVNWGFWHLGEFSSAYRSCFDEMPSQTLNRKSR
jgi:AraC family ethanolamine operon transcriptional activator